MGSRLFPSARPVLILKINSGPSQPPCRRGPGWPGVETQPQAPARRIRRSLRWRADRTPPTGRRPHSGCRPRAQVPEPSPTGLRGSWAARAQGPQHPGRRCCVLGRIGAAAWTPERRQDPPSPRRAPAAPQPSRAPRRSAPRPAILPELRPGHPMLQRPAHSPRSPVSRSDRRALVATRLQTLGEGARGPSLSAAPQPGAQRSWGSQGPTSEGSPPASLAWSAPGHDRRGHLPGRQLGMPCNRAVAPGY